MNAANTTNTDSLEQTLAQFREQVADNMPADMLATLQGAIDRLAATQIADKALSVGDSFPAFSLPDANGLQTESASLLAKGPLIVNFYRGSWCPYCNFELQAFQSILPEIHATGGQLIAVSPQLPDLSLSTVEKNALEFTVLSDTNNSLAAQLGIRFDFDPELKSLYEQMQIDLGVFHGSDDWQLPVPATYVIDRNATIVLADIDANYTRRLEPEVALAAFEFIV